jgi:hypothetical protein
LLCSFQSHRQQISVVAATAIFARLVERFHGLAPDPEDLVDLEPETLRELGLSRQKATTVLDLAKRFVDGRLSEAALRTLPDEEAIRQHRRQGCRPLDGQRGASHRPAATGSRPHR